MHLSLNNVFHLPYGQTEDAKFKGIALTDLISEVETVFLIFHANKDKFGIQIKLIVFVLKGLNGMETNVWHALEEKHGNHSKDVNAQQDTSLQEFDVKNSLILNVRMFQIASGMEFNVSVTKDLKLLVLLVNVME